jgi:hypothetical protein
MTARQIASSRSKLHIKSCSPFFVFIFVFTHVCPSSSLVTQSHPPIRASILTFVKDALLPTTQLFITLKDISVWQGGIVEGYVTLVCANIVILNYFLSSP